MPIVKNSIFLVGPMGVGKTTIGKHIASLLHFTFKDSDYEIEQRTGATITLIFELEGETGFRKRERNAIEELTLEKGIVLSTGGGAVLSAENRHCLKTRGYVIYLHAGIEDLLERTAFCRHRPLLQTDNPRDRLEKILRERHPLYKSVADVIIETGGRSIRQVVHHVMRHIYSLGTHG